ncbi:MAG: serine/threonine protein kinase [Pseudomonadota bacterium]
MSPPDGHPYDALAPEVVLGALESVGFPTDGRLLALNSFENRVYQCGREDGSFVVAKFYRPGRWTDAAIDEEHAFTVELAEADLPVVPPLARHGATLFRHAGFRFALFPRRGGRPPDLEGGDTLEWLGRTMARLHAVGERRRFLQRARIDVDTLVRISARHVLASPLLPPSTRSRYAQAVGALADRLDVAWDAAAPLMIRLHGDCHPGNLLWTDAGPLLLDLDDARSGPALQDLWMLFGDGPAQRDALLAGYAQFRDLDPAELSLAGPLRLMRQVHFAGWIAQRWDDPAFPRAFPFAAESRWWDEHVSDLFEALDADAL